MKQSLDDKKLTPNFYKYCGMYMQSTYCSAAVLESEGIDVKEFLVEIRAAWHNLSCHEKEMVHNAITFIDRCEKEI